MPPNQSDSEHSSTLLMMAVIAQRAPISEVNWNIVASCTGIKNGHAARMRWCRLRDGSYATHWRKCLETVAANGAVPSGNIEKARVQAQKYTRRSTLGSSSKSRSDLEGSEIRVSKRGRAASDDLEGDDEEYANKKPRVSVSASIARNVPGRSFSTGNLSYSHVSQSALRRASDPVPVAAQAGPSIPADISAISASAPVPMMDNSLNMLDIGGFALFSPGTPNAEPMSRGQSDMSNMSNYPNNLDFLSPTGYIGHSQLGLEPLAREDSDTSVYRFGPTRANDQFGNVTGFDPNSAMSNPMFNMSLNAATLGGSFANLTPNNTPQVVQNHDFGMNRMAAMPFQGASGPVFPTPPQPYYNDFGSDPTLFDGVDATNCDLMLFPPCA